MNKTMFIQLIDAMNEISIDVTTIDAAKITFDKLLKVIRRDHGYNFEKEMATIGISSCITFRTWLNDESTHSELIKYAQGRKVLEKYEKSVDKFNLAMASLA